MDYGEKYLDISASFLLIKINKAMLFSSQNEMKSFMPAD